jgi:hypothetical protein
VPQGRKLIYKALPYQGIFSQNLDHQLGLKLSRLTELVRFSSSRIIRARYFPMLRKMLPLLNFQPIKLEFVHLLVLYTFPLHDCSKIRWIPRTYQQWGTIYLD